VRAWLVDTGPLVSYRDARDPAHESVADRFDMFTGRRGRPFRAVLDPRD
jgi:predicted nucleic acid-binding protein